MLHTIELRPRVVCFLLITCLMISGCLSMRRPDLSRLSVGMTKQQVIEAMGRPTHVSVERGTEYLQYEWDKMGDGPYGGAWVFVRLVNGRVDAYGEKGDFGTTSGATLDVNIHQR